MNRVQRWMRLLVFAASLWVSGTVASVVWADLPAPPFLRVLPALTPTGMEAVAYSFVLQADDGVPPYTWHSLAGKYLCSPVWMSSFAESGTGQSWFGDDAVWTLDLPFSFPFYGRTYTRCFVDSNGALRFDHSMSDPHASVSSLTGMVGIAVMWADLTTWSGDVFVENGTNSVTVRWRGDYAAGGAVNFSIELRRDGRISLRYGAGNAAGGVVGISAGDGRRFDGVDSATMGLGWAEERVFSPVGPWPAGLVLSEDGRISGIPTAVGIWPTVAQVRDSQGAVAEGLLSITILPNPNRPPVIQALTPPQTIISVAEQSSQFFRAQVTDPEEATLVYTWRWNGNMVTQGTANTFVFQPQWGDAGTGRVDVQVSDGVWNVTTGRTVVVSCDNDGDGMPNAFENRYGLDPWSGSDAARDLDFDRLSNLEEYRHGTHPKNADTDGDSLWDGWEVQYGFDPCPPSDGISGVELKRMGSWTLPFSGEAEDVALKGSLAVVACGIGGVQTYDVADPANARLLGGCDTAGWASKVRIAGDYAYVVGGAGGVDILDIGSPSFPSRVGVAMLSGSASQPPQCQDLAVLGRYAYVAAGWQGDDGGVRILDLVDPSAPVQVGVFPGNVEAWAVTVTGGLAYVAGGDGLEIYDVQTPQNPKSVGRFDVEDMALAVWVDADYAYLVTDFGVQILDVSDPTAPVRVGQYVQDMSFNGDIYKSGSSLYLSGEQALEVIDVSSPSSPSKLSQYDLGWWCRGGRVKDQRVFLAAGRSGWIVLDATDPSALNRVAAYETGRWVTRVRVQGGLAYVLDDHQGLFVFNVVQPSAPRVLGAYLGGGYNTLYVSGNFVYLGGGQSGKLEVLDVSDPKLPTLVGTCAVGTPIMDIRGNGEYLYVASGSEKAVHLVNVMDPAHPELVGTLPDVGYPFSISVANDRLYVAGGVKGLTIAEVSDPTQPEKLSVVAQDAYGVAATTGLACVSSPAGIWLFDMSNPQQPAQSGVWNGQGLDSGDGRLTLNMPYLYMAGGSDRGLSVIDVSDPAKPQLVDTWEKGPSVWDVDVDGNIVYVAADSEGLQILELSSPDSDGDGLRDAWELQWFASLARNGRGDFDGDGILDIGEYNAGLNPKVKDQDKDGLIDGVEVTTLNSDPRVGLSMPTSTLRVVSEYGQPNPSAGDYLCTNGSPVDASVAAVAAGPADGIRYRCSGWTLAGNDPAAGVGNELIIHLTNSAILSWQWVRQYRMSLSTSLHGSVDQPVQWVDAEARATATATADPHYHFAGWTGDTAGCTLNGNSITMPADRARAISAVFVPDVQTLTVVSEKGQAIPVVGEHSFDYGTAVDAWVSNPTITTGTIQYVCTGWTLTGPEIATNGSTSSAHIPISGDMRLTWIWQTRYWLDVEVNGHGVLDKADSWQAEGSSVSLTAIADPHYHFMGWTGDTSGCIVNGDRITVPANRARTIGAGFAPDVQTLTVVSARGQVAPAAGAHSFDYGSVVDAQVSTPTIAIGTTQHVCTGWTLTGAGVATNGLTSSTRVPVSGDLTLTWVWQTRYWLDVAVVGDGTLDRTDGWCAEGSSVTLTATPDPGQRFSAWSGAIAGCTVQDNRITAPMGMARRIVATFVDANLSPPKFQPVEARQGLLGRALTFVVIASDQDGTSPELSAFDLPQGATFVDQGDGTGVFAWTPSVVADIGETQVTFRASDGEQVDGLTVSLFVSSFAIRSPTAETELLAERSLYVEWDGAWPLGTASVDLWKGASHIATLSDAVPAAAAGVAWDTMVPAQLEPGDDYWVSVADADNADDNAHSVNFSILPGRVLAQEQDGTGGNWTVGPQWTLMGFFPVMQSQTAWKVRDLDGNHVLMDQESRALAAIVTLETDSNPRRTTQIKLPVAGVVLRAMDGQRMVAQLNGAGGAVYVAEFSADWKLNSYRQIAAAMPGLVVRSLDGYRLLVQFGDGGAAYVARFRTNWTLESVTPITGASLAGVNVQSLDGDYLLVQAGKGGPGYICKLDASIRILWARKVSDAVPGRILSALDWQ